MSNYILLSNEVELFYFLEFILLALLMIAFLFIIPILKNWDFSQTSSNQYRLEKRSYLINTIIYFSLFIKIFLIGYFIYTVDLLSSIIPGAMCATGVFGFNDYGYLLLINKIVLLFFSLLWIVVNHIDLKRKNFPYFKTKSYLFLIIILLVLSEVILDVLYFSNLSTESLATCCSVFYDTSKSSPLPFGLSITNVLILFYVFFISLLFSNHKKYLLSSFILNSLFIYIGYYALIYFFGTYIYQLPTHHCPFCMLQKEYLYIGYLVFITLFAGIFFSISNLFLKLFLKEEQTDFFLYSNISNTLFTLICTAYLVVYYFKNGVLL